MAFWHPCFLHCCLAEPSFEIQNQAKKDKIETRSANCKGQKYIGRADSDAGSVVVVVDIGYRTADDMHEDTDPHTLGH